MSSQSSKRAARKAAMSRFKNNRKNGFNVLDDDAGHFKEEEDVYEMVDQEEYKNLVESRRQREDFVVDDDGIGYYDDGEECLGDEDQVEARSKKTKRGSKSKGSTADLTARSLKKMRKNRAAQNLASSSRNRFMEDDDTEDKDDVVSSNRSMWDFVNVGANASAGADSTSSDRGKNSGSRPKGRPDLDEILGELDDPFEKLKQSKAKSRGGRGTYGSAGRQRMPQGRRPQQRRPAPSRPRFRRDENHYDYENEEDNDFDATGFADDDDDNIQNTDVDPPKEGSAPVLAEHEESTKPVTEASEKKSPSADDMEVEEITERSSKDAEGGVAEEKDNTMDTIEEEKSSSGETTPPPRRRLLGSKKKLLQRRSAPALKAAEKETAPAPLKEKETPKKSPTNAFATPIMDTNSASFSPQEISAEPTATAAASSNLESYVQCAAAATATVTEGDDSEPQRYIDFYYMDAAERRNGDVHLFGKVAVPDKDAKDADKKFVSCCAVVKGNLRNLFVLPRRITGEDGEEEYAAWNNVHEELKGILQPKCIPKIAGASWAGKVVQREYAFDDPEVPREKTAYMKVVYDAKYPAPDEDICFKGREYVAKILNGKASTLETFLLKRKLMGPCWLRIQDPNPSERNVSWCAVELQVPSPKQVLRLDSVVAPGTPPRPAPPVVAVTLKLKTVVNPKTAKNEIVSVSAVCHKRVLLDTGTDQSPHLMTQVSLIRPIHLDDGTNGIQRGMAKFPRDIDKEIATKMPQLKKMPNERALLSMLVTQIGNWDPDVLVGHHAWGHDIQVLLTRCVEHKVRMWSKFGRQRRTDLPSKSHFSTGKDWAIAEAISGRLLCDTYLSAQEHLNETTYSLTNLAKTQLKANRQEIEPMDTPQYFQKSETIVALARHTLNDAQLVQRLMFKLQILPLSKQLTNIAGNLWSQTLKSNRAGRTEYLLLHEFHRLKFLVPEKHKGKRDDAGKAKYAGGLVLDPKRGLYDTFILLLDFNSLYPSLIQEYNLCFTTVTGWATFHKQQIAAAKEAHANGGASNGNSTEAALPPLPDESQETGVLAKVIKSLVGRRRQVKGMMKKENNSEKYNELDIKQKAFKLTANSMYGCLGFSNSRFYAQPIAALVTSMGRQTLHRTVDIAQSTVGLEVIYGDTDSIMINTRISDTNALPTVRKLGEQVKKEVNKLYKTLELEIDGIFRTMLLLKKKKYAAVTVEQKRNGEIEFGREEKGLDLVRRDWCVQSKDTGHYVLDQILSREQEKEVTTSKILNNLEELAQNMRDGKLPLEKYVITKGLSKHPKDYPDGRALPHVHVAKMMIKNNRRLTVGDHIPYVICEPLEAGAESDDTKKASKSATERARHPDEIARSGGILKPDVEWYLTQQILPPVSRLCEPIEGLSQGLIAQRLGLNSSKYTQQRSFGDGEINDEELVNYVPESFKTDKERFGEVKKLRLTCASCRVTSEFPGLLYLNKDSDIDGGTLSGGFRCTNPSCQHPQYWGEATPFACMARIMNAMSIMMRGELQAYYHGSVKCDDPACGLETRQLSVNGGVCLARGCNGRMNSLVSERSLQTQLKYFECLFDVDHVTKQLVDNKHNFGSNRKELTSMIAKTDKLMARELLEVSKEKISECSYNWIAPSFWQQIFGGIQTKQ